MLQAKNASKKKLLVELPIGTTWKSLDKKVTPKVDTGSDENVMNEHTFRSLFKDVQLKWKTMETQMLKQLENSLVYSM